MDHKVRPQYWRSRCVITGMSNVTNKTVYQQKISKPIRSCPFCGYPAELVGSTARYGIRCYGCSVFLPAIHSTPEQAIALWHIRRGTASAAGGRATRGLSSRKKRRACRRNLRRARQARALLRSMEKLRSARAEELREAEQALAKSRAKLKALEPAIMANPALAELYDLIRHRDSVHHSNPF